MTTPAKGWQSAPTAATSSTGETPRLSRHARERCAEMGISTKVAKAIVRTMSCSYPGRAGTDTTVMLSDAIPEYGVVVGNDTGIIVTVIFNAPDFGERAGATYKRAEASR